MLNLKKKGAFIIVKKSLLITFVLVICYSYNYSHVIKNNVSECTGKIAKERLQLFVQAEKHELNLINAHTQCLQVNNCDIDEAFKQARGDVLYSIVVLIDHLNELEAVQIGTCVVCEKNETIDIKNRLIELLKSTQ